MSRVLCSGAPDCHLSTEHGEHRVCGLGLLPVTQGVNEPSSLLSIPRASTSTQLLTPPAFKSLTQTLFTQSTAYWIPSVAFSMGALSANMELIFSLNFSHSQWGNKTETWESFSSLPFPYRPHLIAHMVLLMSLQKPLFSILDVISSFGLLEPGSIPHVELPVIFPKKRLSKSFEKKWRLFPGFTDDFKNDNYLFHPQLWFYFRILFL